MSSASQLLFSRIQGAKIPTSEPPTWSPAQLFLNGELGVWYNIQDQNTLYQDSAKTQPITSDGQIVRIMEDQSPNGFDAFAPGINNSKGAVFRTDGSTNWLEFDGVQNWYTFGTFSDNAVNAAALFIKFNTPGRNSTKELVAGNFGQDNRLFITNTGSGRDVIFRAIDSDGSVGDLVPSFVGEDRGIIGYSDTSGNYYIRFNGQLVEAGTLASSTSTANWDKLGVSTRSGSPSDIFSGRIYEVFISQNVSAENLAKAEEWIT